MNSIISSKEIVTTEIAKPFKMASGSSIVGELWIDNCLLLIIDVDILKSECDNKFAEILYSNSYYTVLNRVVLNERDCLIVKPKNDLTNMLRSPQELLSEREMQIVELVALGKSNKQIGKKLKISEWTVSTHLRRIFAKLKVDSRASMVYHCATLIRYRLERSS